MKLADLDLTDCLVVGFSRDAARNSLALSFEAFDSRDPAASRVLFTLECSGLTDVKLEYDPEFLTDLNRPYDPEGHDQRANEIHEIRRDAAGTVHLKTDMMRGTFRCAECRLLRVLEVEA
jgi:hypothetical protein